MTAAPQTNVMKSPRSYQSNPHLRQSHDIPLAKSSHINRGMWASSGSGGRADWPMSLLGQTEKKSVRAYVFRFALELGHCTKQSACLKGAMNGLMQCSKQRHSITSSATGSRFDGPPRCS